MRIPWRPAAIVAGVVLLTVGLALRGHIPVARAAQTWNVQTGGDLGPNPAPASGNSTLIGFFPSLVTVNAGDTVSWSFPSALDPHGVAFDNGQQPPVFEQSVPGPGPGEFDITATFLPLNLDKINGVFNPSVQFASGVPTDPPDQRAPFTLQFNTP